MGWRGNWDGWDELFMVAIAAWGVSQQRAAYCPFPLSESSLRPPDYNCKPLPVEPQLMRCGHSLSQTSLNLYTTPRFTKSWRCIEHVETYNSPQISPSTSPPTCVLDNLWWHLRWHVAVGLKMRHSLCRHLAGKLPMFYQMKFRVIYNYCSVHRRCLLPYFNYSVSPTPAYLPLTPYPLPPTPLILVHVRMIYLSYDLLIS